MNLEVLNHIISNAVEKIEELSKNNNLESDFSVGIANFLLGNEGNVSKLSTKQRYHYDRCIKPLIERVSCYGVIGSVKDGGTCNGDGYIDDESLWGCYLEDDFKCQICKFDTEKMYAS